MALQRSCSLIHVISKDRNTISLVVHPFKAEAIIKILIKKNQDAHKKATIKKKTKQLNLELGGMEDRLFKKIKNIILIEL